MKTEIKIQPEELAKEFSKQLRKELPEPLFTEMVAEHIEENAANEPYCVSHDYCDANMAMGNAFKTFLGYLPDINNDKFNSLWNKAWKIAKENDFYFNQ